VPDHRQPRQTQRNCEKTHPKPTHEGAEVIVVDDSIKSFLDDYSKRVKEVFDGIWKERYLTNPAIKGYAEKLIKNESKS